MATDLGPILTESLRDRAGRDVDPAPIVRAAVARGARLRRRRQAATMVAAMVAVAGVVATAAVGLPSREPAPATAPLQTDVVALRLPMADGLPGAAQRPDRVGAEPQILHFGVDRIITPRTDRLTMTVRSGTESAEVVGDDRRVHVGVARTVEGLPGPMLPQIAMPLLASERVYVGGRPGTVSRTEQEPIGPEGLGWWEVRWQPGDGVWARVHAWTTTKQEALAVATVVSFDSARRCAVPFRLPSMSAGAAVEKCELTMSTAFQEAELRILDDRWRSLLVRTKFPQAGSGMKASSGFPAGPYSVRRLSSRAWAVTVPPYVVEAVALDGRPRRDLKQLERDVLEELGALRTVGKPDDPSTW
jgi:hypothetical protein